MLKMIIGAVIGSSISATLCYLKLEDWKHDALLGLIVTLPSCNDNSLCPEELQRAYSQLIECRNGGYR